MKFHVLTLFPEMIEHGLSTSIIGRAAKQGLLSIHAVNMRDYTMDKHGKVDDYTYGGGAGMLIQAQPVFDAFQAVSGGKQMRCVYVTPQGRPFNQQIAGELAKEEELVFLCGHYEGIDERVLEEVVTDYISIGDYVLTGGELPAMVMIDAISRLVPGVLNNETSAETESFHNDLLEYPQYSRPEIWHDKKVPEVLLSGNHTKIMEWRLEQSKERTRRVRPDLFAKYQAKEKAVKQLSKEKRNYIHMMESLARGRGELLYHRGEDMMIYDREAGTVMIKAASEAGAKSMLSQMPEQACRVETLQEAVADLVTELWGQDNCRRSVLRNACYTQKDSMYQRREEAEVGKQPKSQTMAAEVTAVSAQNEPGKDAMKYGSLLTEFPGDAQLATLVNAQKQLGWIPYLRIPAEDEKLARQLEQTGLYVSKGAIICLERIGEAL